MSSRGGSPYRGRGGNRGGSGRGGGRGGQGTWVKKSKDTDNNSEEKTPENKPDKQVPEVKQVKQTTEVKEVKPVTTAPVGEKKTSYVRRYGSADTNVRTKGDMRNDTGFPKRNFNKEIKGGWQPKADVVALPTIGADEGVLLGHPAAIHNLWDRPALVKLGQDLSDEGTRPELVKIVGEQLIRQELDEMVAGGNLKSMANIKINNRIMNATTLQDATVQRVDDRKVGALDGFSPQEIALWNKSLQDAEVDTVRDIKAWAATVDPRTLAGQEIDLQIVGNGGPCQSCQKRLEIMANEIMADWKGRGQLTDDQLPRLRLTSYYAYKSKQFPRDGLMVRDGWEGDGYDPNLTFTNRTNKGNQPVFVHPMLDLGPRPAPQIAIPATVDEDSGKSEEDTTTTTTEPSPDVITPVIISQPKNSTETKSENVS